MNFCLKESSGEYIARQDDDDVSYPNRIARQVKFLDMNPNYSIVGSIADIYDEQGVWGEYPAPEQPTKNSFLWNTPFIHPSTIMRITALKDIGGYRVAKETRRCEDYDLFMRLYAKGCIGYNIQEKLYKYRMINDPTKKYRPMKYRIDEAIVRYKGFREMGIFFRGIPYIVKPILIGLIPAGLFARIRNLQYKITSKKGKSSCSTPPPRLMYALAREIA